MRLHYAYKLDTPAFIEEVKRRPLLWDNSVMGYNTQKNTKIKLWDEICEVIDPEYREKLFAERLHFRRLLQRRWKSLRDCFTRELGKIKRLYSVTELAGYKPYCYFKNLGFLLDVVERDNIIGSTKEVKNEPTEAVSSLNNLDGPINDSTVNKTPSNSSCTSNINESQVHSRIKDETFKQIYSSKELKLIESPTPVKSNVISGVRILPSSAIKILPAQMFNNSLNDNSMVHIKRDNHIMADAKVIPVSNIKIVSSNDSTVCASRVKVISGLTTTDGPKQFKIVPIKSTNNKFKSSGSDIVESSKLEKVNSLNTHKFKKTNDRFNVKRRLLINKVINTKNLFKKSKSIKSKKRLSSNDEDKMFLLSLIKELKKVPDYSKLDVKLKMLQVLKEGQTRNNIEIHDYSEDSFDFQSQVVGANITVHNQPHSHKVTIPEEYDRSSILVMDESNEECSDRSSPIIDLPPITYNP